MWPLPDTGKRLFEKLDGGGGWKKGEWCLLTARKCWLYGWRGRRQNGRWSSRRRRWKTTTRTAVCDLVIIFYARFSLMRLISSVIWFRTLCACSIVERGQVMPFNLLFSIIIIWLVWLVLLVCYLVSSRFFFLLADYCPAKIIVQASKLSS